MDSDSYPAESSSRVKKLFLRLYSKSIAIWNDSFMSILQYACSSSLSYNDKSAVPCFVNSNMSRQINHFYSSYK